MGKISQIGFIGTITHKTYSTYSTYKTYQPYYPLPKIHHLVLRIVAWDELREGVRGRLQGRQTEIDPDAVDLVAHGTRAGGRAVECQVDRRKGIGFCGKS